MEVVAGDLTRRRVAATIDAANARIPLDARIEAGTRSFGASRKRAFLRQPFLSRNPSRRGRRRDPRDEDATGASP